MQTDESMIPLVKVLIEADEIQSVTKTLQSGWVTQGPEVEVFENEFAAYVGAEHACAVSNCTSALYLALLAIGVKPGDEVITVSHSFIATANVILKVGAVPVFVDIQSETFNLDVRLIEKVITKKTKAILCVHQMGMPCDLKSIIEIAGKHSLKVIEDAACATGSEILWNDTWEKIGKPHGDIACFSFHPRKVITTGDGGMLTTSNLEWDQFFRLYRQHGMSVPDSVRHGQQEVIFESYQLLGFNYRMTDIQAALGRAQLKRLPNLIQTRRRLADQYQQKLTGIEGLEIPHEPEWARTNWQSYCVRLPRTFDQKKVMQWMLDHGVASRRGIMCSHREPAFSTVEWSCDPSSKDAEGHKNVGEKLIESERAQDHSLLIPLYVGLTDAEQDKVVRVLSDAFRHFMNE